jgi:uncharacterized protein YecE (DUF72 family)
MRTGGKTLWVGISGHDYQGWRGAFYPRDLPRSQWLHHASRSFARIELNGTFDNDAKVQAPHDAQRLAARLPALEVA